MQASLRYVLGPETGVYMQYHVAVRVGQHIQDMIHGEIIKELNGRKVTGRNVGRTQDYPKLIELCKEFVLHCQSRFVSMLGYERSRWMDARIDPSGRWHPPRAGSKHPFPYIVCDCHKQFPTLNIVMKEGVPPQTIGLFADELKAVFETLTVDKSGNSREKMSLFSIHATVEAYHDKMNSIKDRYMIHFRDSYKFHREIGLTGIQKFRKSFKKKNFDEM